MLDDLKTRSVKFRSLTEAIDTETPTGRAMWQMIALLAELERSLIIERTRGMRPGPKPKLTASQIEHARKLHEKGDSANAIAGILNVSRATVYRTLA